MADRTGAVELDTVVEQSDGGDGGGGDNGGDGVC